MSRKKSKKAGFSFAETLMLDAGYSMLVKKEGQESRCTTDCIP
jgi:hypothetical protein